MPSSRVAAVFFLLLPLFLAALLVPLFINAADICDTASESAKGKVTNDCIACVTDPISGRKFPVGASCKVTGGGSNTTANCVPDAKESPGTCRTRYCIGTACFDAPRTTQPAEQNVPQTFSELEDFRNSLAEDGVEVSPVTTQTNPVPDSSLFNANQYPTTPSGDIFNQPDGTSKYLQELINQTQANAPVIESTQAEPKSFFQQTLERWGVSFPGLSEQAAQLESVNDKNASEQIAAQEPTSFTDSTGFGQTPDSPETAYCDIFCRAGQLLEKYNPFNIGAQAGPLSAGAGQELGDRVWNAMKRFGLKSLKHGGYDVLGALRLETTTLDPTKISPTGDFNIGQNNLGRGGPVDDLFEKATPAHIREYFVGKYGTAENMKAALRNPANWRDSVDATVGYMASLEQRYGLKGDAVLAGYNTGPNPTSRGWAYARAASGWGARLEAGNTSGFGPRATWDAAVSGVRSASAPASAVPTNFASYTDIDAAGFLGYNSPQTQAGFDGIAAGTDFAQGYANNVPQPQIVVPAFSGSADFAPIGGESFASLQGGTPGDVFGSSAGAPSEFVPSIPQGDFGISASEIARQADYEVQQQLAAEGWQAFYADNPSLYAQQAEYEARVAEANQRIAESFGREASDVSDELENIRVAQNEQPLTRRITRVTNPDGTQTESKSFAQQIRENPEALARLEQTSRIDSYLGFERERARLTGQERPANFDAAGFEIAANDVEAARLALEGQGYEIPNISRTEGEIANEPDVEARVPKTGLELAWEDFTNRWNAFSQPEVAVNTPFEPFEQTGEQITRSIAQANSEDVTRLAEGGSFDAGSPLSQEQVQAALEPREFVPEEPVVEARVPKSAAELAKEADERVKTSLYPVTNPDLEKAIQAAEKIESTANKVARTLKNPTSKKHPNGDPKIVQRLNGHDAAIKAAISEFDTAYKDLEKTGTLSREDKAAIQTARASVTKAVEAIRGYDKYLNDTPENVTRLLLKYNGSIAGVTKPYQDAASALWKAVPDQPSYSIPLPSPRPYEAIGFPSLSSAEGTELPFMQAPDTFWSQPQFVSDLNSAWRAAEAAEFAANQEYFAGMSQDRGGGVPDYGSLIPTPEVAVLSGEDITRQIARVNEIEKSFGAEFDNFLGPEAPPTVVFANPYEIPDIDKLIQQDVRNILAENINWNAVAAGWEGLAAESAEQSRFLSEMNDFDRLTYLRENYGDEIADAYRDVIQNAQLADLRAQTDAEFQRWLNQKIPTPVAVSDSEIQKNIYDAALEEWKNRVANFDEEVGSGPTLTDSEIASRIPQIDPAEVDLTLPEPNLGKEPRPIRTVQILPSTYVRLPSAVAPDADRVPLAPPTRSVQVPESQEGKEPQPMQPGIPRDDPQLSMPALKGIPSIQNPNAETLSGMFGKDLPSRDVRAEWYKTLAAEGYKLPPGPYKGTGPQNDALGPAIRDWSQGIRPSVPVEPLAERGFPAVGNATNPSQLWGSNLPSVAERRPLYEYLAGEGLVPPVARYTGTEKQNLDMMKALRKLQGMTPR